MSAQPPLTLPGRLLITTFGLGYLRPASGTWGSLPPVVLGGALVLLHGPHKTGDHHWFIYHGALLLVLVLFSCACLAFGARAETLFARKDPGHVVADETAGQTLPLMFLPTAALTPETDLAITLAIAFITFRLCDIAKPWPARTLQRLPAGRGILIDDLIAGLYAALGTQLLTRFLLV